MGYNGTLEDFSTLFGVRWIVNWLVDHNFSIRIEKRSYTSQFKVWLKYHFRWVLDWRCENFQDWVTRKCQCRNSYMTSGNSCGNVWLLAGYHLPAAIESWTLCVYKISFNWVERLKGYPKSSLSQNPDTGFGTYIYQEEPMSNGKENGIRFVDRFFGRTLIIVSSKMK